VREWDQCAAVNSHVKDPVAAVAVRWVAAAAGGRRSGPPTAPVYAATAVFRLDGEAETAPGWPANADQLSILVQRTGVLPGGEDLASIGFLFPYLARPYLHVGAELVILEGPKAVAYAVVCELL
jgi:hypothetical protein